MDSPNWILTKNSISLVLNFTGGKIRENAAVESAAQNPSECQRNLSLVQNNVIFENKQFSDLYCCTYIPVCFIAQNTYSSTSSQVSQHITYFSKWLSSRWFVVHVWFCNTDRLPVGQPQIKLPGVSIHMPPFKQGFPSHSLTLSSQVLPCHPSPQTQLKEAPKPSMHWPPLEHLFSVALQMDTSISQLSPADYENDLNN